MKTLMTLLKHWNDLWKCKISAAEEGRQMTNLVFLKNNVLEALDVHKQYNIYFEQRMQNIKAQNDKENASIIAEFAKKDIKKDYYFCNKPLKDIEVDFEILTPHQ